MRALVIGCDEFSALPDCTPASRYNVEYVTAILQCDARGYESVVSLLDICTPEALARAVEQCFGQAQENDLSLLYISSHGIYDKERNIPAALVLSDGMEDTFLTPEMLKEVLDEVQGQKVIVLDACESGTFIGKGMEEPTGQVSFAQDGYKVLCSAGGNERSWYWHGMKQSGEEEGTSYFTAALCDGCSAQSGYAADENRDGKITLREIYGYVYENYALSTPQVYPQYDDEYVFFRVPETEAVPEQPAIIKKTVTDFAMDETMLLSGKADISFSYTLSERVSVYYQLVEYRLGAWQFDDAQVFLDAEQADGTTKPGRKMRTLSLNTGNADSFGYVMLQIVTTDAEGQTVVQCSRQLCVQPQYGRMNLRVETSKMFETKNGKEQPIIVYHDYPCELNVDIVRTEDGSVVRHIAYAVQSRPELLSSEGDCFYWDGRTDAGKMAESGEYCVRVRTRIGKRTVQAESSAFEVMNENKPENAHEKVTE